MKYLITPALSIYDIYEAIWITGEVIYLFLDCVEILSRLCYFQNPEDIARLARRKFTREYDV